MTEERDDRGGPRTAAEWYVALDARPRRSADDTEHAVDARFAEWLTRASAHEPALERCEAAVTLAQALADDPDLAFAYTEARALASRPRTGSQRAAARRTSERFGTAASRRASSAWPAFTGLAAVAAAVVVAVTAAFVERTPSPVGRAVAAAAAIVASSPPLNGAVLLPNDFAVDARTLAVLPLAVTTEGTSADAVRAHAFAAQVARKLSLALQSVPGLYVLDAAPVPANAAVELAPSAIGALIGARGIVVGTLRDTAAGSEIEIALLDASNDTLLWENRYRADAADPITADAIPSIAAALVALSRDDAPAWSARGTNALTSFGEAEGAAE